VLETAERTLERINILEEVLNSGLSGNELQEFLLKKVTNTALLNGIMLAIKHYKNLDKTLLELRKILFHAIETVASDIGIVKPLQEPEQAKVQDAPKLENKEEQPKLEPKEILAAIIDELDTGKGASFSRVIETAQKAGLDAHTVDLSLKELMDEGRCYEPKIGVLRKV